MRDFKLNSSRYARLLGIAVVTAALSAPMAFAQPANPAPDHDRDRDYQYHDRDWDARGRLTRIQPGTRLDVRSDERIDVNRYNNRVYPGHVEHDVIGDNGRVAIPRGAPVELMVRVEPDNDLVLDVQSVTVRGDRFTLDARPERLQSERMHGIVGAIAGAAGVQVRGPVVDVPRGTVLSFRIERPLVYHAVHDRPYSQ